MPRTMPSRAASASASDPGEPQLGKDFSMLTRIICTGLLLGLSLSVQSPAAAKDAPEVAAETLRYEAWTLRCEARADLKVCGAMSTLPLKDQDGNPEIAMVAMLRSIPKRDRKSVV